MRDFWPPLPEVEALVLQRVQYGVRRLLSKEQLYLMAPTVECYPLADTMAQAIVYELRAKALQHRCPDFDATARGEVALAMPANWWQHWKLDRIGSRLFGWVARCWPVRTTPLKVHAMVTARFDKTVLFPQPTFDYPDSLGPVVVNIAKSLEDRLTVIHEHGEHDPAALHREYREYQLAFTGLYAELLPFAAWKKRRAQRLKDEHERAQREHGRGYGA